MSHSRSSGDSSSHEKKESSNYSGKKHLRCYRCCVVGCIQIYCQVKEINKDEKVVEEEEEREQCLLDQALAIHAMISINLEGDWIDYLEYNIVDHIEKQEINVVNMKQQIFEDVLSGDKVDTIEGIKEEDLEHAIS